MPVYEYQRGDGTRFEVHQSFSEEPLQTDPKSGQKVHRVLSVPNLIYRGTGLSTAYRSRPKDKPASDG